MPYRLLDAKSFPVRFSCTLFLVLTSGAKVCGAEAVGANF